jgi:pyruvate dehydrogenase E2 component (dihydrolipoamide acetyltransferase)
MAFEVVVPRLGWSMDEGTFGQWLKRDGDYVDRGQPLFVLEGEKSAQEIESFDAGFLRIPSNGPGDGDTVKVGQVLAYLVAENESPPFPPADSPAKIATAGALSGQTPAAGKVAAPAPASDSVATAKPAMKASPRARRQASELGVDWTKLAGTGSTGRIRERDVIAAAKQQFVSPIPVELPTVPATTGKSVKAIPVSRLRKAIATRMMAGSKETAPVTLTMPCDASNLASLRQQFRATRRDADEIVPDYNDLIAKLTAEILARHPLLTARWGDQEIAFAEAMHIAIAVDTEAGLLAPVVRNVDQMTLRQLAAESRRLAVAARAGTLPEGDLQGGVFTITNLGMFGIDSFTPVINLPQAAILGIGAIIREPAAVDEKIVIRDRLTLSLTFDHRIVDGAPAAKFLAELRQAIEQPGPWLMP